MVMWWDVKGGAEEMPVGINGQETVCLYREHKLIIALQPKVTGTPC